MTTLWERTRRPRVLLFVALLTASLVTGSRAQAEDTPAASEPASEPAPVAASVTPVAAASEPPGSFEPGVWATLGAIIPGTLWRGVGHLIGGDADTSMTLLAAEGAGLAGIVIGGGSLAATGASRHLSGPITGILIASGALFFNSYLADIYGSAGGASRGAAPARVMPWVVVEGGYRHVYDPQFDYGSFGVVAADARWGAWRLSPSLWAALDDDNQRARLEMAWRGWGPTTSDEDAPVDGSSLEVESAVTYHNFGEVNGFSTLLFEGALAGRYDMARVSPTLEGSFTFMKMGLGLRFFDYDVPGLGLGTDSTLFIVSRFGYGMYLDEGRGELQLFYSHRRDDFAAGMGTTGIGSGFLGSVGLEGEWFAASGWGGRLELEVGSAYVGGASVCYRYGGGR